MAKGYSGRPYRMTSARRAALKKAQIASAKKRKRNKRIKIAAGVGGAAVVAAYAGYKFGPQAGNIAGNLKARTPKNVAGAQSAVRGAVQPLRKQVNRIKNGLTRGKVDGAGPEGASKAPKPMKRVHLSDPTASQVQAIRDAAEAAQARRRPEGRQQRQGYNEDGTIKSRLIGMPRIYKDGRVRRKTMKKAMEKHNEHIMSMGVEGKNTGQIASALDSMVASGNVMRDRRKRRRKGSTRRRRGNGNTRKKLTIEEMAMSQWDKDFGD